MKKIKILKNTDSLAKAAADYIIALSKQTIKDNGRFTWALSGGSTPIHLFKLLAIEDYQKKIDWKNVYIFWSDERYVPASDEDNNSFQAQKNLLNEVPIPSENIFAIPVHLPLKKAAKYYEQTLKQFFKSETPVFDLVMLGMGSNGHTASLFPETEILKEKTALVASVFVEEVNMDRITFTAPFINQAKHILFLVAGADKASMLAKVFEEKKHPQLYPAQLIKAKKNNELLWLLDAKAAAEIKDLL